VVGCCDDPVREAARVSLVGEIRIGGDHVVQRSSKQEVT
jgi:hypothetical protein